MAALATRLRLPSWAQDALLAVFVTYFQIRGTRLVAVEQELPRLDRPAHLGYVLLTASGLTLLFRRRWPVPVFLAVGAANAVYYVGGYPDGPSWVALFVALYTLTAQGDGERSLRIVVGGVAALTVVWLLTADLRPLIDAGWVFFRIGAAIMAAALGESVRSRRVIAEQAKERAETAERTREQEARRRVDAERLRIAREVHDTVAHAIAVINVQAGVTAHVLDKRPRQVRDGLAAIEQTSAQALRELRATLGVLRGPDDGHPSPAPGLGQIDDLAAMAREGGLDVTLETVGTPRILAGTVDHAAYRILQESITNVIRHAAPARVNVTIEYRTDQLRLRVDDDGRGTGNADPRGGGHGLAGMRERCALLGGRLTAGPRPGGGFSVCAHIPFHPEPAVAT
jgi:signal transduction histidine kinase